LVALIHPHARGIHQALRGIPLFAVDAMLRAGIYCLQLWCLSDPAIEEERHERPLCRHFVGLDGARA
jgi:IS5 family transposase